MFDFLKNIVKGKEPINYGTVNLSDKQTKYLSERDIPEMFEGLISFNCGFMRTTLPTGESKEGFMLVVVPKPPSKESQ